MTSGSANHSALNQSLSAIRQILPLPLEQINQPDPLAEGALSRKILDATDSHATVKLAHQLTSRELDLVFPLLAATTNNRKRSVLADRLGLIIRERACPTLYRSGWLTFQKYFPAQPIGHALAILCKILEIKQISKAPQVDNGIRTLDPAKPLISHLVQPDSRHFIRRLIRCLSETGLPLEQFMKQYEVVDDLALGTELLANSFLTGSSALYEGGQHLFAKLLQDASLETQIELVHHLLNRDELPQKIFNRYCQEIYRQYGEPSGEHAIWQHLKSKDRRIFQEWVLAATIGSHCRRQPEKAYLYLRYIDRVISTEFWDADTLLIYFPGFVIADSRKNPQLAIFYAQPDPDRHPFELATDTFTPNPADPAIPHRQVEDAIRRSNLQGTIGLPFDPEGIRLTGIFLNMCQKEKTHGWFGKFRKNQPDEDI